MKVDAERFKLRVSRKENGVWYNNVDEVDLPDSVLDTSRAGAFSGERTDMNVMDVESEQLQG